MDLPDELTSAINTQIAAEFYSASLYLSLSAGFEVVNLTGFAKWHRQHHMEEIGHGLKFFDYLVSRNARPVVPAIPAPSSFPGVILESFQAALAQERKVTAALRELDRVAEDVGDRETCIFLQPFLTDQIESEKELTEIVALLALAGDNSAALLQLNHEFAEGEV